MACVKSSPRSALVAFSPNSPYLASGTVAGAVDLSYNFSTSLEIFKLDFSSGDQDLLLAGECATTERFHRLSWGEKPESASDEFALGLIAGSLADGSIGVWNPVKLTSPEENKDDPFIHRLQKHTGPVFGLEFNPNSPNLLASGADNGELCIWDLSNPKEPTVFPPLTNPGSDAQGAVSSLSWNRKVPHILASTCYPGTTVIWDLKRQKPAINLHSDRKRCSVLQWHPDNAIQLIVASEDDNTPSMSFWDVRNPFSPFKEFVGHTKGVLSMSWCPHDSSFLLTCGKDNRTICWDTVNGEIVSELPPSTNWNFDVHWCPRIPGVVSASSFDGKIGIYNIEACPRANDLTSPLSNSISQAHYRAPKWLKRPVGVFFAFGGKLVSFRSGASAASEVYMHNITAEHSFVNCTNEFEFAVKDGDKSSLRNFCDRKSQEAVSENEQETWSFLKVMFEEEGAARTKLLNHLGYSAPLVEVGDQGLSQQADNGLALDGSSGKLDMPDVSAISLDNGEDFFNSLASPKAEQSHLSSVGEAIDGDTRPSEGEVHEGVVEGTSFDNDIQCALVIGDYKSAVLQCISANRMADALVIAHLGGSSLWESTRDQYLKNTQSSFLKVVLSIVRNDFMGLVKTRPISYWKETLALLCSYAQGEEWTILCDTLASRLMTAGNMLAATLCYMCSGNIDKTVQIWSHCLKCVNDGRVYSELLQGLMEKTVILALATGQKHLSASLSKFVEKYAELLADQGLTSVAAVYLNFLATDEPSHELTILRDRIAFIAKETEPSEPGTYYNMQLPNMYASTQSVFGMTDLSHQYYQDKVQQQVQGTPGGQVGEVYHRSTIEPPSPTGSYTMQTKQGIPDFGATQSFQPLGTLPPSPNMFLPSQAPQSQAAFVPPLTAQPTVKPFVPSTPAALKNVEQYQQPTLGSQLQPWQNVSSPSYQQGSAGSRSFATGPPPQGGSVGPYKALYAVPGSLGGGLVVENSSALSHGLSHVTAHVPPSNFAPTGGSFLQKPPTATVQASQPSPAPPVPQPTIHSVDTSRVSDALKPVVSSLRKLYDETSGTSGGTALNAARKREVEDNSKRLGFLFDKMNSGDISRSAADKLIQLCQALDRGDFPAALNFQVQLTTSEWDECNFWLTHLKRMIKVRQNIRLR